MIKSKPQTFNDGIVRICSIKNVALPGKMPKMELAERARLRFRERTVGVKRFYSAQQNDIKVDRLIRCPMIEVTTQDRAVIVDVEYYIKQIQFPEDITPRVMDLTLEKVVQSNAKSD